MTYRPLQQRVESRADRTLRIQGARKPSALALRTPKKAEPPQALG